MRTRSPLFLFSASFVLISLALTLTGCTFIFQKRQRRDVEKITHLKKKYSSLKDRYDELERARQELERRLRTEIDDREVTVELMEKGLVITFVAEVLFDSGKADLRKDSLQKLSKVSSVLQSTVRDHNVGIEGHTDNEPIRYSGWRSNWELSAARAMSVLHYLEEEHGVSPERLSATGYGEYRPIALNTTPQGRQKNRRVEIVILPRTTKEDSGSFYQHQVEENLK